MTQHGRGVVKWYGNAMQSKADMLNEISQIR